MPPCQGSWAAAKLGRVGAREASRGPPIREQVLSEDACSPQPGVLRPTLSRPPLDLGGYPEGAWARGSLHP